MQLTERQAAILRAVVSHYQATGRPVGSRTLVDIGVVAGSPSTIRSELMRLEHLGLLEHPHTSAGRVPTDKGYRRYVDRLTGDDLRSDERLPVLVDNSAARRIDDALQTVTQALTDATQLLAVATAPRAQGAVIRHIEVLLVQPTTIAVVCITETGDVSKHVVRLSHVADSGLVAWAGEYLNEQVTGMALGQNMLVQRLANPELSPVEQEMMSLLAPAFSELVDRTQEVTIGGSPQLLHQLGSDVQQIVSLIAMLDERRRVLDAMRSSFGQSGVSVRIGEENDLPELYSLSIVGAQYGLASRPLGMIGLIGPRALNYPLAIRAVAAAADGLDVLAQEMYLS